MNPEINSSQSSRIYPGIGVNLNPNVSASGETSSITSPNAVPYLDTIMTFPYDSITNRQAYEAASQFPELPIPDVEGQTGIQPYQMAERKLIRDSYSGRILELLKKRGDVSDEEAGTILFSLIRGGAISGRLVDIAKSVNESALKETRSLFNLPPGWKLLSVNPKDWTRLAIQLPKILAPEAVNQARGEILISNLNKLLESIEQAGSNLAAMLPPEFANNDSMTEFRKVISQAIRDLKEVLRDIQIKDADKALDSQKGKMDSIDRRSKKLEEMIIKREEMLRKQRSAAKMGDTMKILGPVLGGLSVLAGIAAIVASGGAASPLVIAGLAVSTSMFAYTFVDQETGATQSLIGLFNQAVEEIAPDNPLLQKALKVVLVSVAVSVIASMIALSGGGAAGSVGTNVATQASTQTSALIAREIIKQLSTQMIMLIVISSNALPELFGEVLRTAGVDDKTAKKVEIGIMAAVAVLIMVATFKALKGTQPTPASQAEATAQAETQVRRIQEVNTTAMDRLKAAGNTAVQSLKDFGNGILKVLSGFKFWGKPAGDVAPDLALSVQKTLQVTSMGLTAAEGFIRGKIGFEVGKLLEENGDLREAELLLQALIQALTKLLDNIQGGMDTRSQAIVDLQNFYTTFYDSLSQSTTKITRSLQG